MKTLRNCFFYFFISYFIIFFKASYAYADGNFSQLYSSLVNQNLITDKKDSTVGSDYIRVEVSSTLCDQNGDLITSIDDLMPLFHGRTIQPKKRGNAYYLDSEDSFFYASGINLRVRVLEKKNSFHPTLKSTVKFNTLNKNTISQFENSSFGKNELGINSNNINIPGYWDDYLSHSLLSINYSMPSNSPSFWKNTNTPSQFSQYQNNDQGFIAIKNLSNATFSPFSAQQFSFLAQKFNYECNIDINHYKDNLGIRAAIKLTQWEREIYDTIIELDIEERKRFFPSAKTPYYVVSYKVKASTHYNLAQTLINLLNSSIDFVSKGSLQACEAEEEFHTYLYNN